MRFCDFPSFALKNFGEKTGKSYVLSTFNLRRRILMRKLLLIVFCLRDFKNMRLDFLGKKRGNPKRWISPFLDCLCQL